MFIYGIVFIIEIIKPGIDFKQPWLEIRIKENIETIQLEATFVIYHNLLHGLECFDDNVLDLKKRFTHSLLPESYQEKKK